MHQKIFHKIAFLRCCLKRCATLIDFTQPDKFPLELGLYLQTTKVRQQTQEIVECPLVLYSVITCLFMCTIEICLSFCVFAQLFLCWVTYVQKMYGKNAAVKASVIYVSVQFSANCFKGHVGWLNPYWVSNTGLAAHSFTPRSMYMYMCTEKVRT